MNVVEKNYVSVETAAKLQGAGFEQPEYKFGQLWYMKSRADCTFVGSAKFELFKQYADDLVFAPTATDILRETPTGWAFSKQGTGEFFVFEISDIMHGYSHENPAEAAALAWLETRPT